MENENEGIEIKKEEYQEVIKPDEVIKQEEIITSEETEKRDDYVMLSVKPSTKKRLGEFKIPKESWDAVVNRILDKVIGDGNSIV